MQTFLPYEDFTRSAQVLDRMRLGKQRVEGMQILQNLLIKQTRWKNHPAVLMWQYYELSLCDYLFAICDEWISRGYKDTCKQKISNIRDQYLLNTCYHEPFWLGSKIHATHRSNLLRKLPRWYRKFGWSEPIDLDYYWPVKRNDYVKA